VIALFFDGFFGVGGEILTIGSLEIKLSLSLVEEISAASENFGFTRSTFSSKLRGMEESMISRMSVSKSRKIGIIGR